ncbi:hypothetical protein Avbf_07172 [Armadillidium vulgare]|nr:hypothetical protein Avbf_07172 [Armadillidium vulgare]
MQWTDALDSDALLCCIYVPAVKEVEVKKGDLWANPLTSQRLLKGQFYLHFNDLKSHPTKFFEFHRMSIDSFNELLLKLEGVISKKNTVMRRCVPSEERLSVTLRYLATGESFISLHYQYLIGVSTIRKIVSETCYAIWTCLGKTCIPEPTKEKWLEISKQFYERTRFPNCLGIVDSKLIHIHNFKKAFSLILMTLVDSDYLFTYIDVETWDKFCDANVFQNSTLGKRLRQNEMSLPPNQKLPQDENGQSMPFVFIGDETFPTSSNVLRPYPKGRLLNEEKEMFNNHLSRTRRRAECAFRILANKWNIFHRPLDVNSDFAVEIIRATCVLHNFQIIISADEDILDIRIVYPLAADI